MLLEAGILAAAVCLYDTPHVRHYLSHILHQHVSSTPPLHPPLPQPPGQPSDGQLPGAGIQARPGVRGPIAAVPD
eukprot:9015372-Pyramimonas_sp.AAC.1